MILTLAQDYSSNTSLDSELTAVPESGMYLNSGVHPLITVSNLLTFLPKISFTASTYNAGTTYGKYIDSRSFVDVVDYNGVMYQSLVASNIGNTPDVSPSQWLETNIESLRVKSYVLQSQDNAINKLNLSRRLVDNQYLYNVVELSDSPTETLLPNDYAGWVFEPKGSDYVKITINQMALQAKTATPQSLYVINQGVLVDTLTLNPNVDGRLVFEDIGYSFQGKGRFIFAIDSQLVLTNGAQIDPLKYEGFVAYAANGIGATPEGASYSFSTSNNGLSFNVSSSLDASVYINNNLINFGRYIQAAWELDVLNMMLYNANARSNKTQRNEGIDPARVGYETTNLTDNTVAKKLQDEKRRASRMLSMSYDRALDDNDDFVIEIDSI